MIDFYKSNRGFTVGDFIDLYNNSCSIQESSLATQPALWLGVDDLRMHLTQGMAENLIPLLQHFVDTGNLPDLDQFRDATKVIK